MCPALNYKSSSYVVGLKALGSLVFELMTAIAKSSSVHGFCPHFLSILVHAVNRLSKDALLNDGELMARISVEPPLQGFPPSN